MPHNFGQIAGDEFGFAFETNQALDLDAVALFLSELARTAKSKIGPDARLQIQEIGSGSLWARIKIIGGMLVGIAAIGEFGIHLGEAIKQPRGKLAEAVAVLFLDSGVVEARIVTREKTVTVHRNDVPSVSRLEQKRERRSLRKNDDQRVIDPSRPIDGGWEEEPLEEREYLTVPSRQAPQPTIKNSNFATQRFGSAQRPDPKSGFALLGKFELTPDGTALFKSGDRVFRVNNPGIALPNTPMGQEVIVDGRPFTGSGTGIEDGIHVFRVRSLELDGGTF